jgi:dihydroflavonol-4-reductase
MHEVHVAGTRLICAGAVKAGVRRMVLVSTSGTVAVSRDADDLPDEDRPAPLELIGRWPYYASKYYQEETAVRECGDRVELVRVNPSLFLGPGDDRLSSTRDVLNFLAREVPVIPAGGVNFVDVRDVAAALLAAMEKGRPGQRYLLGGYNWTLREFFGRLSRISKVQGPRMTVSDRWRRVPHLASRVQSAVLRGIGRTPRIQPEVVDMGEYYWFFTSDMAVRELGFHVREASETLFDTVDYLRTHFLGQTQKTA